MLHSKPSDDGLVVDLPSKNLLDYWLKISTQDNASGMKIELDEWDKKTYILLQVVDIAQRIYSILGTVPEVLGIPEEAWLRSSITIPLPGSSMASFVARDSRTGYFFSPLTFSQFRWGPKPVSIAGYSASTREEVVISN